MKVVVVGQGYVGLPVAMLCVERGMDVVGVDIDPRRVRMLSEGHSPVEDIPSSEVQAGLAAGTYRITDSYDDIDAFDVAVVTVPTPLSDASPDLSFLVSACTSLAPKVRPGSTVIVESTTYPGSTQHFLQPMFEEGSGLKAGTDFALGFSPERIDPGNTVWTLRNTPKVVSGVNEWSLEKVKAFYDSIIETTVPVPTPMEAEFSKLLENTFRHVNIALVNELAVVAKEMGVDIWATIDAAASKPFGFMKFLPGPGVGGHCLPIDPTYLSWEAKRRSGRSLHFIELANEVNLSMPRYIVERVGLLLNHHDRAVRSARILVLGLGYKKNTSDLRESPAMQVVERLVGLGADVRAVDPHIDPVQAPPGVALVKLDSEELAQADLVLLLTDHDGVDYGVLSESTVPVLDTRHRLTPDAAPEIIYL